MLYLGQELSKMSKNKIIEKIETEQMGKEVPEFGPGDTVVVQVKIKEGDRERLQAFEGVVIGKRNAASILPLLFVRSHTVWV